MRGYSQGSVIGIRLEPVFSLQSNSCFCYEVLSLLTPGVNTEKYFRLLPTDKAIDVFIRQVRFIRTIFSSGCFSFNIPAHALVSASLLNSVCHELMPGFIIEIQDPDTVLSMMGTDIRLLTDSIHRITARGGKVWVDDITREMEDFFLALKLPLDGVKIDKSILHGISGDHRELTSFVETCHELAPLVVVEGIDTTEMQQRAQHAGAQAGQGFLWPGKTFMYPQ